MAKLAGKLENLAAAYEHLLFNGELSRRLAHHLALVASELWLAIEFALLVNEHGAEIGLPGWSAIVEKNRVDVSLIPPDFDPSNRTLPDHTVYLEFKQVSPEYWANWNEVLADLSGKPNKPRADYAVCFLFDFTPSFPNRKPKTAESYKAFQAAVPTEPADFEPIVGQPLLRLVRSSNWHRISWPYPVACRWPKGFEADIRTLWITLP
jgi:hypothetical protein